MDAQIRKIHIEVVGTGLVDEIPLANTAGFEIIVPAGIVVAVLVIAECAVGYGVDGGLGC